MEIVRRLIRNYLIRFLEAFLGGGVERGMSIKSMRVFIDYV